MTKSTYRGRHFAFNVTDDNFHAIVDKLHAAGIEERDDHGEREGRRPEQLGTYFREPSGFRLQITNENSAEFAAPRKRLTGPMKNPSITWRSGHRAFPFVLGLWKLNTCRGSTACQAAER